MSTRKTLYFTADFSSFRPKTLFFSTILLYTVWYIKKSKTPLQATGYQICSAASSGVFDPRGSRQISMQAWLLGSLLAGIKNDGDNRMKFYTSFQ